MPSAGGDLKRKRMLGVVHMAAKQLGLDTDDYRAIVRRVTGCNSAGDCSPAQLHRLIAEFERLGYKGKAKSSRDANKASHPIARKARALWIGLHALGAIDDVSEKALERFAKRQLKIDRLHWADQSRAFPLIEALKARAEREGWDQAVPSRLSGDEAGRLLTERLYDLITQRLCARGVQRSWPEVAQLDDAALWQGVVELGIVLREVSEVAE